MSLFNASDLALLAQESLIAKHRQENEMLNRARIPLLNLIQREAQPREKLMKDFINLIRAGKGQLRLELWRCYTVKFAPHSRIEGRDCRDEIYDSPEFGKVTILDWAREMNYHVALYNPSCGDLSIWKILRFTNVLRLVERELGSNFICYHDSMFMKDLSCGELYEQCVIIEYLPKGRTPEQEARIQEAYDELPVGECSQCGAECTNSTVIRRKIGAHELIFCSRACRREGLSSAAMSAALEPVAEAAAARRAARAAVRPSPNPEDEYDDVPPLV
jgi:hypothetical protein